jgi:hypothetical protein
VASLTRDSTNPRPSSSRAAPHGASSDGPPAPHRLEQPLPRTTPISDIPRRHRGHRLAGSRTDRKLAKRTPCDVHPAFDPRDLDRRPAAPFGTSGPRSGCLPSCHAEPGSPLVPLPRSPSLFGYRGVTCAPFSPRSRRGLRQQVIRSAPRPAAPRRLALRLAERKRRAMRRTDFCHLTSSYQYPRLAGSRCVVPLSRCSHARCLPDARQRKLASAGRTRPLSRGVSSRWALSSRRDACVPSL